MQQDILMKGGRHSCNGFIIEVLNSGLQNEVKQGQMLNGFVVNIHQRIQTQNGRLV